MFPTKTRLLVVTATVLLGVAAPGARATDEIPGFKVSKITGNGVALESEYGTTSGSTKHSVNQEDCAKYLDYSATYVVSFDLSGYTRAGDARYAVAFAPAGKTCVTTGIDNLQAVEDGCSIVTAETTVTGSQVSFDIDFEDLIGDCEAGSDGVATVYVYIDVDSDDPTVSSVISLLSKIEIDIDLERPDAPTLTSLEPGDRRLQAKWDEAADATDDTTYIVAWADRDWVQWMIDDAPDNSSIEASVHFKFDITSTSYSIEEHLDNGTDYWVGVFAVDGAGNESDPSALMSAQPVETLDFWEQYRGDNGPDPGGFCFVATAAYGTPMANELGTLRLFRDRFLMTNAPGRGFVTLYYRWGRFAAAWLVDKPLVRAATRAVLAPLVWLARLCTTLGLASTLALLATLALLLAGLRRRWIDHILSQVPGEVR